MNKDSRQIAKFLKSRRMALGLTQADVAAKLGYSTPQFVSNWERACAFPPVSILKDLAKLYQISADDLFEVILENQREQLRREYARPPRRRRL